MTVSTPSAAARGAAMLFAVILCGAAPAGSAAAKTLKSGDFTGASGHDVSGSVRIEETGGKAVLQFSSDFAFDGAPDPKVAFGRGGYDPKSLLGPLKSDAGAQNYAIPAGLDVSGYNEVWIWCEEFAVPLGMARIK
ncbi:DM13 domain-containing protein [Jiella endophytica]|uniref:DM13 domain-containing protein n=1 Tax=Jiella endophytica TaxID=2558362 RepID=UPI0014316B6A|nr:DM13 domain-containing protein [Jiella endophytica]